MDHHWDDDDDNKKILPGQQKKKKAKVWVNIFCNITGSKLEDFCFC